MLPTPWMSESDHISSSDDGEAITIQNEELIKREIDEPGQMDMLEFLKRYGPEFNTNDVKSELDILRDIGSFQQYLDPKDLKFNYNFNEESYNYYSKLQNVVRIELTEFRDYVMKELKRMRHDLRIPGYYYELGSLEPDYLRPEDYYDRARSDSRRNHYYDRPNDGRRRGGNW